MVFSVIKISIENALIRPRGNLQFTQQEWEIVIDLNLEQYFHITYLILECKNDLTKICERLKDVYCQSNIDTINGIQINTRRNINEIKFLRRSKRFIFIPVLMGGVSIMSFLSALNTRERALLEIKRELRESNKLIDHGLKNTQKILNVHEKIIEDNEKLNYERDMNISRVLGEQININKIMINLIFIMREHDNYFNRLKQFFLGNIREKFLSIIDIDDISKTIDKINSELFNFNLKIPEIKYNYDIEIIKIDSSSNVTHTNISLKFPILYGKTYEFFELIPVPTMINDELSILYSNTIYFIRDNENIQILNMDQFPSLCKTARGLTICNSAMEKTLGKPNECEKNYILYHSDLKCFYKPIDSNNYFIKNSDHSLYIYVHTPIKLMLHCDGNTKELEINKSREIAYLKTCSNFHFSPQNYLNQSTISKINAQNLLNYPKIQIYDMNTEQWISNISIIEQNQIHLIPLKQRLENIGSDLHRQGERIDKIELTPKIENFTDKIGHWIEKFITKPIIKNIAYLLIFILIIIIIKYSFEKLIRVKCFSTSRNAND